MADNSNKKIAQLIQSRWTKLNGDYQEVFDRNATYTDMFRSILNFDDAYPWDYRLVDPAIFQLMRTMMARLNPDGARVDLFSRNSKVAEFREHNQKFLNWELSEMKKTLVFFNCIQRGLIGGRSYLGTGWLFEPAIVIKSDITGKKEFVMRDIVNRATARNIRFDDIVVPNRNLPFIDEQPYIIEHQVIRYGEMIDDNAKKEVWSKEWIKKIADKKMFVTHVDGGFDLPNDVDSVKGITKEDQFLRNQYVGLLKMSTKDGEVFYTFDGKGHGEDVLNVDTTNPYWHGHYPYLSFTPFPEDDEYFSQGIVQPLEDLTIALSSSLNQFLTNARKAGNPMWVAGASASQTPDWQFVNRPDGVVRVAGDANQIRKIEPTDTSNLMNNLRQQLSTLFEKSSSISSLYSSGVSSTSQINRTATGAKVIDANIDLNMQMLVSLFGAQILQGIGTHFLELNSQYVTEEQEVRISGDKGGQFIRLKPEETTANFDVVANPDTITKTSTVVRQAALLNLKSTMDGEKNIQLDAKPVWKAIFASYPEVEEIDEDIIIDPQVQAEEIIGTLEREIEPVIDWNMNHKAIRKIIQVYVMSNQDSMDDKKLKSFAKTTDELTKWIDADKIVVTMEQQAEALANPAALPSGLGNMTGENGGLPMINEQQIEQSAMQSADPMKNMPNQVPLQDAGLNV